MLLIESVSGSGGFVLITNPYLLTDFLRGDMSKTLFKELNELYRVSSSLLVEFSSLMELSGMKADEEGSSLFAIPKLKRIGLVCFRN